MGRIGIMGGTFDPIHKGHLLLGRQALKEYRLDQVWYMPSGQPPHKRDHDITDVKDRLAMIPIFFCLISRLPEREIPIRRRL